MSTSTGIQHHHENVHDTSPDPIVAVMSSLESHLGAAETGSRAGNYRVRLRKWRRELRAAIARKDEGEKTEQEEKRGKGLRIFVQEKHKVEDNEEQCQEWKDDDTIADDHISEAHTSSQSHSTDHSDQHNSGVYSLSRGSSRRGIKTRICDFCRSVLEGIGECACCSSEHILVVNYYC